MWWVGGVSGGWVLVVTQQNVSVSARHTHTGHGSSQTHTHTTPLLFSVASTHTLASGFFLEKSQARPRSEMPTSPCSPTQFLAG